MKLFQKITLAAAMFGVVGAIVFAPAHASAVTLQERNAEAVQDYRDARTTYRNEVDKYNTARNKYLESRNTYRNNRTDGNLDVAIADAKAFLLQTGDSSISYLQMLRTKVESMSGITDADRAATLAEIDSDITYLQGKKTEVENATTKDELTSLGSEIRTHWENVRADAKRIVGKVLAARVNYILAELETLSATVDTKIDTLSNEGANVVELNRLNSSFKANLSLTESAYDNALEKFNAIDDLASSNALFTDGREFVEDADTALRAAHSDLKDIVAEIQDTPIQSADVAGTGTLNATGSGTAVLDGNGTVVGSVDSGGQVIITDDAGDVQVSGGGGTKEVLEDGRIKYTALAGEITITGTDMYVEVIGSTLTFDATGTGSVTLKGTGTYTTGGSDTKRSFTATPVQINIAQ